ncbi:MAG: DNA repair protein RecO [Bdellovibrionaceae bacterium]|nr:DNA repair protein RecO [Pseudobdellovibrionaceae bacterium]
MKTGRFIILKTTVFKENDLIVYALNSDGDKKHFLARGALKSKKRFGGGVLEAMNHVELQFDDRRDKTEFIPLSDARLLDGFEGIRKDYDRLTTGLVLVRDVFQVAVEGSEDNYAIYNLLGNTLKKLETVTDRFILLLHFRIKLLFYAGYLPNEDGLFNPFLAEQIQSCEKLKTWASPRVRSTSENALRELGVYI